MVPAETWLKAKGWNKGEQEWYSRNMEEWMEKIMWRWSKTKLLPLRHALLDVRKYKTTLVCYVWKSRIPRPLKLETHIKISILIYLQLTCKLLIPTQDLPFFWCCVLPSLPAGTESASPNSLNLSSHLPPHTKLVAVGLEEVTGWGGCLAAAAIWPVNFGYTYKEGF